MTLVNRANKECIKSLNSSRKPDINLLISDEEKSVKFWWAWSLDVDWVYVCLQLELIVVTLYFLI